MSVECPIISNDTYTRSLRISRTNMTRSSWRSPDFSEATTVDNKQSWTTFQRFLQLTFKISYESLSTISLFRIFSFSLRICFCFLPLSCESFSPAFILRCKVQTIDVMKMWDARIFFFLRSIFSHISKCSE